MRLRRDARHRHTAKMSMHPVIAGKVSCMGPHCVLRSVALFLALAAALAASASPQEGTAVVHGRTVDRDGKPMAGCAVALFDLGDRFDTKKLLDAPQTSTDAEGRYRLEAKQNHYHVVVVAKKGHQVCVQRLQGEPGAERHLPDALMLPGATLRGRVRDVAGKVVAGALVRVEDPLSVGTFVMSWFESQAESDASGIFEVPGVPRTGLQVTVSAPGCPAVARFAAHDSPLDFTLLPTGLVRGRVVDAAGKPIPKLGVSVITVERQDGGDHGESDAEGRFVVTVPRAHRFRVVAYEDSAPYRRFSSRLLHGPADDVVLSAAATAGSRQVTVRCVDAASKAPLEQFHASWCAIDAKTAVLALMHHPEARRPYRGEAVFAVAADPGDKSLGTIVVDAPGHGYAIVPIPDDPTEPLTAELGAESSIVGLVLDAETGKPAVGAAVRALPHCSVGGGGPDPWQSSVITDANGRYRIGGLVEGRYDVQVYGVGRPASTSAQVTLARGAEGTLDLEVPKVRFLDFELVGDIPPNCLGQVSCRGGVQSFGMDSGVMLGDHLPMPPVVPVSGARAHRLGPVGHGEFRASLLLPTRDRVGSCMTIELGKIDGDGTRLVLPDLRQFVHSGRVVLPADVPTERIAVVAHRQDRRPNDRLDPVGMQQPLAVCLGSDGSFAIDLAPGQYALQLVDLETGLCFYSEAQDRSLGEASVAESIELVPPIHWLEIAFEPTATEGGVVFSGVSLDAERSRGGELPAMLHSGSGSNRRQQGFWAFRTGTSQVRWLVAAGNLKVGAMQTFELLRPGSTGYRATSVDGVGVDIAEPVHRVTLRIPPPPSDAELEVLPPR